MAPQIPNLYEGERPAVFIPAELVKPRVYWDMEVVATIAGEKTK